MHDPNTVAFTIPYRWRNEKPFKDGTPFRYWVPLFTIWHVDPERDGSDDSCGWSRPKLTKKQKDICKALAIDEVISPWFMKEEAQHITSAAECELLLRGAIFCVSRALKYQGYIRREVSVDEATRWASLLTNNGHDNLRSSLCFLSGYHSNTYDSNLSQGKLNSAEDDKWWRERQAQNFFYCIMAYILRERRWWFQHPKWHIHHWRIKCEPLLHFKRWAFSRCSKCGKRFKFGEAPVSYSWHGTGPLWFKSEQNIAHTSCDRNQTPPTPIPTPSPTPTTVKDN